VCCSVLQCVAVRCSALQCIAGRCSVYSVVRCVAVRCSVLQGVAVCFLERFPLHDLCIEKIRRINWLIQETPQN